MVVEKLSVHEVLLVDRVQALQLLNNVTKYWTEGTSTIKKTKRTSTASGSSSTFGGYCTDLLTTCTIHMRVLCVSACARAGYAVWVQSLRRHHFQLVQPPSLGLPVAHPPTIKFIEWRSFSWKELTASAKDCARPSSSLTLQGTNQSVA